jgi:hypothetical protein
MEPPLASVGAAWQIKQIDDVGGLLAKKENKQLYRSCTALFYRKRLPQQQRDRWMGERETSTH